MAMKIIFSCIVLFLTVIDSWQTEKFKQYDLLYTEADARLKAEYASIIHADIDSVEAFTGTSFPKRFEVYIHPNRQSLDLQWQKDWAMPEFKSECWMVASGIASKMDILSPRQWEMEACEHSYSNQTKTRQLLTHELFHVYHGQLNASPDFSNVTELDWLVEGFATYASGQVDVGRIGEVKNAIAQHIVPTSLSLFWTGKLKYGLAGSVVLYIDRKFGRAALLSLLPLTEKSEALQKLGITEQELLTGWQQFIKQL